MLPCAQTLSFARKKCGYLPTSCVCGKTSTQPAPLAAGHLLADSASAACRAQTVSVAQKKWGYLDASGTPSPQVLQSIQDVDAALGAFMTQMRGAGIASKSAIILSAKHGQV